MVQWTTDKKKMIKLFNYLVGQAEEGNIKRITAIRNGILIQYNKKAR